MGDAEAAARIAGIDNPFGLKVIRTLMRYSPSFEPWEAEEAMKIESPYGATAMEVFAKHYTTFPDWALKYGATIDNPFALEAFIRLADEYATLYDWQMRWAGEVHSEKALQAYSAVILRKHTEKEEALAALADGDKASERQRKALLAEIERARAFEGMVRDSVAALPRACRARVNGLTVSILDEPQPKPGRVLAQFDGTGTLSVYRRNFSTVLGGRGLGALRAAILRSPACARARKPAPKSIPFPRIDDLALRKLEEKTLAWKSLVSDDMDANVTGPSKPQVASASPPGAAKAAESSAP